MGTVQDLLHRQGGFHRKGTLFDDDLGGLGILQDLTGRGLPELQVRGHAGAGAEGLGGRVDADENDVVVPDAGGDIRAEEEVFTARGEDQIIEPRFVDGQGAGFPFGNALGVGVHDGDFVFRALVGDHGHRRPADIPGPDTENILFHRHCFTFTMLSFQSQFSLERY